MPMRVATAYIYHFVYACEIRRRPELACQRVIIGDADPPRRVLDCSPITEDLGVFPGMQIRQALSRAPEATYLSPDHPYYADTWARILDSLWAISPEVEDAGLGEAYLNISGLLPHFNSEATIGEAILALLKREDFVGAVGIAEGKFPARTVARTAQAGRVAFLAKGEEAQFVADLSVALLPSPPELIDRLRLLGLDEIGDLSSFPLSALIAQFGPEGSRLWQLVHGDDPSPLLPRQPVPLIEEWVSFEGPVVSIEVLVAAIRQLVSRLTLQMKGRGTRELCLRAMLTSGRTWEKKIVLREAISEMNRLLFITKTSLTETPPSGPVLSLGLRANGLVGETGRQLALGQIKAQDNLQEALRQLKAHYGHSPIYQCVEGEPWSVIPEDRHLLIESDA
jgi:nucleotidyltransferase/DNA polymerase involved in DNA repair